MGCPRVCYNPHVKTQYFSLFLIPVAALMLAACGPKDSDAASSPAKPTSAVATSTQSAADQKAAKCDQWKQTIQQYQQVVGHSAEPEEIRTWMREQFLPSQPGWSSLTTQQQQAATDQAIAATHSCD